MNQQEFPKYTAQIFDLLSKGKFLSSLSRSHRKLYAVLENETSYLQLKSYFSHINFTLTKAEGYFYFSRDMGTGESLQDWERKIEQLNRYVDVLGFLYALEYKPMPGMRFRPTQLAEECSSNPILQNLLNEIKTKTKAQTYVGKIRAIAEELSDESFFEKLDEDQENYLILDSFKYLEETVNLIQPIEEIEDAQLNNNHG